MKFRQILAVIGGSILQWYDFALFGTLAPILVRNFFPAEHHVIALLYTFALFSVSFLLAPIGAAFFGHIGDRWGRKQVLMLTILLMTIPTVLIAILPSYHSLGFWATGLLIIFRLAQGFVASPEFSSAAVFLVESAPDNRKAFYGCLVALGYTLGLLLGGIVTATALSWFPHVTWAWRIPFAVSIIGALIVFVLRHTLLETNVFNKVKHVRLPLWHAIKTNKRACSWALGSAWVQGVLAYGCFIWGVTYCHSFVGMPLPPVLLALSAGLLVNALIQPWFGLLADIVGRRLLASIGLILMSIGLGPAFLLLRTADFPLVLLGFIVISILMAIAFSPLNALVIMRFLPSHRMSGFGTMFNIGMAVFGGTAPLILTGLLHVSHSIILPIVYLIVAVIIGIVTVIMLKPQRV